MCWIDLFVLVLPLALAAASNTEDFFHRCFDEGEAYSGSVVVSADRFKSTNLTYSAGHVSTELASFVFMETRRKAKLSAEEGAVMQSLDVLDLSVVHLSAYERSLRSRGLNDVVSVFRQVRCNWQFEDGIYSLIFAYIVLVQHKY